jgi:hypothetical protein
MNWEWSIILKGSNVIIDIILVTTGVFTALQIWLRKKIKKWSILRKRMIIILYLADTLSLILVFFSLYALRLAGMFWGKQMTLYSFKINILMSISAIVILGYALKFLLQKLKKTGKKMKKKATMS